MNTNAPATEKTSPDVKTVWKNCWSRTKSWVDWLCHPEGPSFADFVRAQIFKFAGIVLAIIGLYLLIYTIAPELSFSETNKNRYLGGAFIFLAATLYFMGKHARRVELKTGVYNEDIDALIGEAESNIDNIKNAEDIIRHEIEKLQFFKEKPSEVSIKRLTYLRKQLVYAYDDNSLKSYARSDLMEYKFLIGEHENYQKYECAIEDFICRNDINGLRAKLRALREEIDAETFSAGKGEAILESLAHWSIPAIFSLIFIGLVPLLQPPYLNNPPIHFVNWAVLGMTGAILYSVNYMRKMDTIRVGADEGNLVLRVMLLGILLGAVSAILLYVAIKSGIFAGKVLPKLNEEIGIPQTNEVTNALSVFWAIASGFSAKIAERIVVSTEVTAT